MTYTAAEKPFVDLIARMIVDITLNRSEIRIKNMNVLTEVLSGTRNLAKDENIDLQRYTVCCSDLKEKNSKTKKQITT